MDNTTSLDCDLQILENQPNGLYTVRHVLFSQLTLTTHPTAVGPTSLLIFKSYLTKLLSKIVFEHLPVSIVNEGTYSLAIITVYYRYLQLYSYELSLLFSRKAKP